MTPSDFTTEIILDLPEGYLAPMGTFDVDCDERLTLRSVKLGSADVSRDVVLAMVDIAEVNDIEYRAEEEYNEQKKAGDFRDE